MVTNMFELVFYKDDDVLVELDEIEGNLYVHCKVHRWSHNVLKKLYSVFANLERVAREDGYSEIIGILEKHKFARLFGFEYRNTITVGEKVYEEMIWQIQ